MAYDETIKSIQFSGLPTTFTATTTQTYFTQPIKGEIQKVMIKSSITGSLAITVSGLGEVIYNNNATSGASYNFNYPRVFGQLATGSIAGAQLLNIIVDALPLQLALGSVLSGTTMKIADLQVFYK